MNERRRAYALLGLTALAGWCTVIGLASLWLFAGFQAPRLGGLPGRPWGSGPGGGAGSVTPSPGSTESVSPSPDARSTADAAERPGSDRATSEATSPLAPRSRGTTVPRPVTATPPRPGAADALPPPVDWPATPDLSAREPLTRTQNFRVFPASDQDRLLVRQADAWAPRLEEILATTSRRLGGRVLSEPVDLVFARAYPARCPARGLAATRQEPPLLMIFLDDSTSAVQLEAVLAHEMAHHLSLDERFVGDGVLTEGIANWGGGGAVLRWQGFDSWPQAVRRYWREGRYLSITDPTALSPRGDEDCIARRDRVYNIRTAFVDWLIQRIGVEALLAMPVAEVSWTDEGSGETGLARLPDYERAAGASLAELERRFLASLSLGGPEVVMLQLRPELQGVDLR